MVRSNALQFITWRRLPFIEIANQNGGTRPIPMKSDTLPSTTGLDEEFLFTVKNDSLHASYSTDHTSILASGLDNFYLKFNLLYFISRVIIRILIGVRGNRREDALRFSGTNL